MLVDEGKSEKETRVEELDEDDGGGGGESRCEGGCDRRCESDESRGDGSGSRAVLS